MKKSLLLVQPMIFTIYQIIQPVEFYSLGKPHRHYQFSCFSLQVSSSHLTSRFPNRLAVTAQISFFQLSGTSSWSEWCTECVFLLLPNSCHCNRTLTLHILLSCLCTAHMWTNVVLHTSFFLIFGTFSIFFHPFNLFRMNSFHNLIRTTHVLMKIQNALRFAR